MLLLISVYLETPGKIDGKMTSFTSSLKSPFVQLVRFIKRWSLSIFVKYIFLRLEPGSTVLFQPLEAPDFWSPFVSFYSN